MLPGIFDHTAMLTLKTPPTKSTGAVTAAAK